MITVVAALIKKDGKVLIARRSTGNRELLGKWEFPGGKVEANEREMVAIEREILEEFEVKVQAVQFLTHYVCETSPVIDLRLYECEYLSGDFQLHAHSEYQWVNIEELLQYDLAVNDIALAQYLIGDLS